MKEMLKDLWYIGLGAAFYTKEKIEELRAELVGKGKMSQEEGKQFFEELLRRSEKAKDQLTVWVQKEVEERMAQFNLATREEVDELRRQVEELQAALKRKDGE